MMRGRPNLFVSVLESRESELLDSLRRGDIEIAILRLALLDPAHDMRADVLFDERLCVVAAKDHLLAGRTDLTWPELLEQPWVLPPPECIFFEHVVRTLDEAGLRLPPRGAVVLGGHPARHGDACRHAVVRHALEYEFAQPAQGPC